MLFTHAVPVRDISWADPEGRGARGPHPLEKSQNIGFHSNSGPDPLKNHKATKPAFNVGPSSGHQRNAIEVAFRWRAIMARLLWYLHPPSPHQLKKKRKNVVKVGHPLTKLSGSAHAYFGFLHI